MNSKPKLQPIIALTLLLFAAIAAILFFIFSPLSPFSGQRKVQDSDSLFGSYVIANAAYPESASYPDESLLFGISTAENQKTYEKMYQAWRDDEIVRRTAAIECRGKLGSYTERITAELLSTAGQNNIAFSPVNIYLALAMLAELTDGTSREQVLATLSGKSIEEIRSTSSNLWNANYQKNEAVTTLLASSLWLKDSLSYNKDTMQTLADTYYASSFQGDMTSPDYTKALQDWLNVQTDGLLSDQSGSVSLDPRTVLALATTISFKAKWSQEFIPQRNTQETFHSATGDVICEFMHQDTARNYYFSDKFSAVGQAFENSTMYFLLPDEGVTLEELLSDEATYDFMLEKNPEKRIQGSKHLIVHFSVPKFDISSDLDLVSGMRNLGITDVFDPYVSNFTPMLDKNASNNPDEVFLSSAKHAARVTIDEEGCTATAYTVMAMCGSAMPPTEEINFVLDRPFLFYITGATADAPLFIGIVNHP